MDTRLRQPTTPLVGSRSLQQAFLWLGIVRLNPNPEVGASDANGVTVIGGEGGDVGQTATANLLGLTAEHRNDKG